VSLQYVYKAIFPINSIDIVAQAYNGAEAVDLILNHDKKIDVIVMDQRMPVMDGIAATKSIMEVNREALIIVLSADESSKDLAIASGARLFLTKPTQLEALVDAIESTFKAKKE
jgi:DNA-binding NarL/FixJ family response regulator